MARRGLPAPVTGLAIGVLILAGCAQVGPTSAPIPAKVAVAMGVTYTVGSGGVCLPDLAVSGVRVGAPEFGAASGAVSNPVSADQVRIGTVPPPPVSYVVATGKGPATGRPFANLQVTVYETGCAPVDVEQFYVAVLHQNQWQGDFQPASGTVAPINKPQPETRPNVVLADLADFTSGAFVNVNATNATVAYINVLAAIVAPGTGPTEQHPTYVQVVTQQTPNPNAPTLAPPLFTTPDVGASGGPPSALSTVPTR